MNGRYCLICCLLFFGLSACLKDKEFSQEEVNALMQKQMEMRVERFRSTRAKRCTQELLAAAILQADSMMLIMSRDEIDDPGRPDRPDRPDQRQVSDSLIVAPLFEPDTFLNNPRDTSRIDSLSN
ncbi:MAG: hypothetical protein HRU40_04190 [Saprospiraceae bacterium]|jgi:hypothetical protein|nr:hypothetical protein [Saprospiraceae bacterium]